jgi:Chromo (CHRromatin Organisation MOdifier) domain
LGLGGLLVELDDDEEEEEVEYFNPEMAEVYRIISCDTPSVSHATAKTPLDIYDPSFPPEGDPEDYVQYLVKWRGLTYAESTWERWEDLKVRVKCRSASYRMGRGVIGGCVVRRRCERQLAEHYDFT